MKPIQFILLMIFILSGTYLSAQEKTDSFMVCGNCMTCKTMIEKAGSKSKVSTTYWNAGSKMAYLRYDTRKTNSDQVLKQIALAGFDNDKYLAPDDVYAKLPDCCRYERVKKTSMHSNSTISASEARSTIDQHGGHSMEKGNKEMALTSQLKPVFDHYFDLKDALVKTDGNGAATHAASLMAALNGVRIESLAAEEHIAWMKLEKELKQDTKSISETENIGRQREWFMTLSKNMYELIKVSKPEASIYYQFCPMANDGKGANWLSKESGIKNPYYGSEMLTCGRTVETIKP